MVLQIDMTENVTRVMDELNVLQKQQLPFAIARSLTRTAAEFSQDALPGVLEKLLDRPTPFTKRSGRFIPATKSDPTAAVYLAPLQDRYLRFQVRGGSRIQKGMEAKYETIAEAIAKRQLVPGKGAKLNQYGNVSRATIMRLGQQATQKNGKVFIGELKGKGTFGVWQRLPRGGVEAVFIEPPSKPSYRAKLNLMPEVEKFASERFDFHFRTSIAMLD